MLLRREGIAEQRRAIDLHRIGRHPPAFGATQLDALGPFLVHSAILARPGIGIRANKAQGYEAL